MKALLTIIILLTLASCSSKILFVEEALPSSEFEIGQIYVQLPCNNNDGNRYNDAIVGYTVNIAEPIFSDYVSDTITTAEFKQQSKMLETFQRYKTLKVREWSKYEAAYALDFIPSINRSSTSDPNLVIMSIRELIAPAKFQVTYYKKEPKLKPQNYFSSKCKIGFAQYTVPHTHHLNVSMIQEKLIDLGYNLKVTSKMDESTEKALIAYQKSKGLYEGQLGYETLHSLGLDYKSLVRNGVIEDSREVYEE